MFFFMQGVAMLVYYVIRDEDCLRAARRLLSSSENREWTESRAGDTSLSCKYFPLHSLLISLKVL